MRQIPSPALRFIRRDRLAARFNCRGAAALFTFAALLIFTAVVGSAADAAPQLLPGKTITIQFPEMPPTFCAISQKNQTRAQMTIFLPKNYDPARKHPLLILLSGGDGGPGGNPGVARAVCEEKDFVCVSMPLFKATDPKAPGGNFVMVAEDGKYMWPFFKTMLAKLEETVPNLDPAQRILGGFSNGAHATAAMLDGSEGEISKRFSAFIFVEGGGKLKQYDLLKDKPFLMVSSNTKSQPRAQQICDAAKAAGARATLIVKDVGKHDFPISAYPLVNQWLRGPGMGGAEQKEAQK